MPHELDLILTLTGGLTAALAFGFITQRLRLSPIVGYLLAGILVGPFTPGFVADKPLADQLAEIGVILLMFGVGLQFHVRELLAVRKVAVPGALIQIAVATALGGLVGRAAGWSWAASLVFGVAISVASTVVLTRVLSDSHVLHTPAGHLAIGWLVLEDVFTVLVLVLLPALLGGDDGAGATGIAVSVGVAVLKLAGLVAFVFIVGQRVIPVLLGYVAKTGSRELFTLTVLVVALGVAVGSAVLFGSSMALGAFLGGLVVGQSDFSSRAASEALPMRDAFAVLFFVSVGMLLDPAQLAMGWPVAAATLAVVLIGKPLAALVVVVLLRRPLQTAFAVALSLAQIGEFSFILATLGRQLGIMPDEASQALVVASIASITLNPLLFSLRDRMARSTSALLLRRGAAAQAGAEPAPEDENAHRTVVVGYGPVGRTLTRLLRENGIEPAVVELNLDTVKHLQGQGIRAIYGDATQREILERAGVGTADSLLFTSAGPSGDAVIEQAKGLNPGLFVLARAFYMREVPALKKAGADVVVTGEAEVAFSMTERLLVRLGATAEQVERERERVRSELFGTSAPEPQPAAPAG
ncbi:MULTISPECIES: cation:proton antiporter [Sorangium]|uniref:Sodium/hydrogen exchanger n=1 Tax=Sorangium cellulosum TaxID=56 RepID=A0A4P2QQT8_SORCE|nr:MULTISPECIES: cation:proton antiporter [Sorangium]AUX32525.1 sodium/hydrogen exchanger [Sorangium cellulosum]WCQ91898.1 Putative cation/proton antiporter YbaL [Sorangium sp. Soce836]